MFQEAHQHVSLPQSLLASLHSHLVVGLDSAQILQHSSEFVHAYFPVPIRVEHIHHESNISLRNLADTYFRGERIQQVDQLVRLNETCVHWIEHGEESLCVIVYLVLLNSVVIRLVVVELLVLRISLSLLIITLVWRRAVLVIALWRRSILVLSLRWRPILILALRRPILVIALRRRSVLVIALGRRPILVKALGRRPLLVWSWRRALLILPLGRRVVLVALRSGLLVLGRIVFGRKIIIVCSVNKSFP